MEYIIYCFNFFTPFLIENSLNIITSFFIFVLGWNFSNFAGNFIQQALQISPKIDSTILPILKTLIIWTIRTCILITILSRFGIQTTSIITMLGAAGLAIGLALQGTLQNIAAGIMLLILRPIRTNEYISINNIEDCLVKEIGLFLTTLSYPNGIIIIMPNSTIWGAVIKNFSRTDERRIDIYIPVNYDDSLDKIIEHLTQLIKSNDMVLNKHQSSVNIADYKENYILINVRAWTKSINYSKLKYQLNYQIWEIIKNLNVRESINKTFLINKL
ncbi:Small-conductance mechanosensitive channel [Candidatus Kinetoplastibacterium sorsogonicusi]|uniref:Small-conductance mechanosensitive channel n=1 Tax=Candidatus Kinetoplastidibacterium kentomonadis TaxID=1576550 RepID=A0A3S7J9E9_9PROT|nr:mechanosensitive ion channel domain-containing protein [Candidatus Kinetoplastibacterium sorsogonicusi]AWD32291.1 Small-conductance mechanosensitive channel [Candidatus Kinetoplastibacterium sorsogonicusi]